MQAAGQLMSDPQVSQGVTGMIESLGQQAGGRAGQSGQSPQRDGGPDAIGGGLGAILQGLGPMMQQLAVGASGQPQGGRPQGTVGTADGSGSSNDWKAALSELDAEEKAEWERIIRYILLACLLFICGLVLHACHLCFAMCLIAEQQQVVVCSLVLLSLAGPCDHVEIKYMKQVNELLHLYKCEAAGVSLQLLFGRLHQYNP